MTSVTTSSSSSLLTSESLAGSPAALRPELKSNDLNEQCYCGKSRNFDQVELQCCACARWFHKNCIDIDTGPLVKFMSNYQFFCKQCGPNKQQESFAKKQASFHQMCLTTLANLICENKHNQRLFFSKEKDIIPYIEKHWEAMTNAPRRVKSTWHSTISRTLTRDDVFVTKTENFEHLHGLKDVSLEKLGPFNENLKTFRSGGDSNNKQALGDSTSLYNGANVIPSQGSSASSSSSSSKRGSKRKNDSAYATSHSSASNFVGSGSSSSSRKRGGGGGGGGGQDLSRLEKLVPTAYPADHPFNKDGYRYHLVEPDPHSPMRQKFEETELWAGKPLPGHLYRVFLENRVALALHDRAPQLKLNDDRMCVVGEKGYSMVRATHGCSYGSWYFEVTVKEKPNNSALRIGWAQSLANLQAPCGYDKFSYSWRSRKGTRFHDSIGKSYSTLIENENQAGYGVGDVLGFYIQLPLADNRQLLSETCKDMTLVKFKNHLYYEEKDDFNGAEKKLTPLKQSKIEFFKNGVSHGVAYTDIYQGVYYPAVSIYKNASVVMNFGPNFKHSITDLDPNARPISDLAKEKYVENALSDLVYHVVNDAKYLQSL